MRVPRPAVRPIVLRRESPGLPVALPTVPRVVLLVLIVLPIRDLDFVATERSLVADSFFVAGIDGVLLPITVPIFRPRSVRCDDLPLFALSEVEGLVELTAGCLAPVGAEELRVPIVLPIRERWLVVGCFFVFERDGVLRLLEPPIREAPLERAAGCFALLGTDGLVVLIVLPIREVILGLILLLVLVVGLFVVIVRELLLLEEIERLLDGVLVLIELPIRDVMLELILPFELLRFDVLLLGVRLVMDLLDMLLLGALLVIDLLELLLLVIDLLDMLLLGDLLVMDRLELLLLGVRLVIDLLDKLLLELLLLGVRLAVTRLELRLDETLLERLDDDDLDVALGAGAGLETRRLCLLELLDLLLLDRVLAAKTGSQNNKRANKMQQTRKSEPSRRDSTTLIFDF